MTIGDTQHPDDQCIEGRPERQPSGIRGLLGFLAIALAGLALSLFTPVRHYLTVESIEKLSQQLGLWGPIALVSFGAFGPLFFLPRWPVCFAGGILYGVVWGAIVGHVASVLGAWIHYATSRALVSTGAERLLARMHIDPSRLRRGKLFWLIVLLRAIPVSNSAMTNVLAGAVKMPTGPYLAASFLGMIPSTVMYAAWGKLLKKPDPGYFALALGLLAAMMLGSLAARRYVFRSHESQIGT